MTGTGVGPTPEEEPLHRNRARASSFGANAELYDATRPSYPAALVDDLVAGGPAQVLDVGCGTGLLGRAFVERGLPVLGVEPDPLMAEVARRHGLDVEVATFEGWDPAGRRFDLLVAGQSWHWVEPVAGAARAAEVLRPGGVAAAAWNVGSFDEELAADVQAVYERLARDQAQPLVPHRRDRTTEVTDSERAFVDTGGFDGPELAVYAWEHHYTTTAWLAQLETHSDHALLAPEERAALLAALGEVLDAHGGVDLHYDCEVVRFRRR